MTAGSLVREPVAVSDPDLGANALRFSRLVQVARARARDGRFASAVEWAWIAARFGTTNPTYEVRSAALERVFDSIAQHALPASQPLPRSGIRRRVLHVVSESHGIGGVTRLVSRWIQRDVDSASSVVVTRHDAVEPSLVMIAQSTGGAATALGAESDAIDRARRLRELAGSADVVLCHLHPDDHVAALAFGKGYAGAPVALFNHSDHMFLLAPTQASVMVDFRQVGAELNREARGYPQESMYTLPLLVPTRGASRETARGTARSALGFCDGDVVALTVARAVKFRDTPLYPRFRDLVEIALTSRPELVVCAVGATEQDSPWDELAARFPGRVRAVGIVTDPQPYFDAADLYLDTYPFSSLTSLLEASEAGCAVLTYDGHTGLRRTLGIADFVVAPQDRPTDLASYAARVAELVGDADLRARCGAEARGTFLALAPEGPWLARLEGLYQRLAEVGASGPRLGDAPVPEPDARFVHHNLGVYAMEIHTPLIAYVILETPRFDARDRAGLRPRVLLTRALQKAARLTGRDPRTFDSLLLPPVLRHREEISR